uniref:Uncharacterized protein n=1 Tax=Arundo donax TaxID=35708 RepID=A0A0A9DVN8_ARUDO
MSYLSCWAGNQLFSNPINFARGTCCTPHRHGCRVQTPEGSKPIAGHEPTRRTNQAGRKQASERPQMSVH